MKMGASQHARKVPMRQDEETDAVSASTRSSKARTSKTTPMTKVWQITTKPQTAKVLTPLPPVNQGK